MKRIIHWFVPKEEKFFEMLSEQSENMLQGAKELKDFVGQYQDIERNERKSKAALIKKIEQKGDEISHDIIDKLNKTFITPIDKEDIHEMAILVDDLIDLIDVVASRLVILGIERIDPHIIKLSDIMLKAATEININVVELKRLKPASEHYARIHALEKEADEVYHNALSELFHFYKNPIDIIKYKEIYELLERTLDKCENISHVIEAIVVKHA